MIRRRMRQWGLMKSSGGPAGPSFQASCGAREGSLTESEFIDVLIELARERPFPPGFEDDVRAILIDQGADCRLLDSLVDALYTCRGDDWIALADRIEAGERLRDILEHCLTEWAVRERVDFDQQAGNTLFAFAVWPDDPLRQLPNVSCRIAVDGAPPVAAIREAFERAMNQLVLEKLRAK